MFKISNTTKQIILTMLSLSLIFLGIAFLLKASIIPFLKGLFVGVVFSILKLILIEKTIEKSLKMDKNKATLYTSFNFILRYVLTAFVLIIVLLNKEEISFIATVLGVIVLQPATYIVGLKKDAFKNS